MTTGFRYLVLAIVASAISASFLAHLGPSEAAEPPRQNLPNKAELHPTPTIAGIRLGLTPDEVKSILGEPTFVEEVQAGLVHWSYSYPYPEAESSRNRLWQATLAITFEPKVTRVSASAPSLNAPTNCDLGNLILKTDLMPHLSPGQSLGVFRGRLPGVTGVDSAEGPFFPKAGPKFFFPAGGAKVAIATLENRVAGICIADSFDEFWPREAPEIVLAEHKNPTDSTFCGICFVRISHGHKEGPRTHPCPFGCQDCFHNRGGTYIKSHGHYGGC